MIFLMFPQYYIREDKQSKTVQVYAERLYGLANDAFAKVDKGVVES